MRNTPYITIAIDGPAGAGKSSVADRIMRHFSNEDILYIEAGSVFRAVAYLSLQYPDLDFSSQDFLQLIENTSIDLTSSNGNQRITLDGLDITEGLGNNSVTKLTPKIAENPAIRKLLNAKLRAVGTDQNTIMTGRSIGISVFPDADLKIYLEARPEIRAERRRAEISRSEGSAGFATVLEEIQKRDERDRNRQYDPMKPAQDAIIIDTSDLSLEGVTRQIITLMEDMMFRKRNTP